MKTTNIEKAIDLIRRKGAVRTHEIADYLGIKVSTVSPSLVKPVEDGYLITCRVEMPGKPSVTEYRLSATVSESKISWEDFKVAARNKLHERPLSTPKARPPRVPAGVVPTIPAQIAMASPAVIPHTSITVSSAIKEADAERAAAEVRRWLAEAKKITFMIGCDGCLRLQVADLTHTFTKEQTCAAGDLLTATQPIWSHA